MAKSDSEFINRLVERLDGLDPNSVQGYILKLTREKGLLETIFSSIREGVIIIDRTGHMQFVNRAAYTMLGLPQNVLEAEGELIQRHLKDLDWERLMSLDPEEWERVSRQQIEVFYPRYRSLLFYLLPYKNDSDPDPELGMAIIILHDITELRESAEEKIEVERLSAISLLAAGVAHEIGNPLNSLTIHLQLLERYLKNQQNNEEGLEMMNVALDEVRRLDKIIHSFLDAVRPNPISPESVSLEALVTDTLRIMMAEIDNRKIDIYTDWGVNIPNVQGDPEQLQQAFYNIINNAIQAMSDGDSLSISQELTDDDVIIRFTDTGEGIPANMLDSIFEPYISNKDQGTGLGLVIVERIIREHGADLGIESEPGVGSTFSIKFPLRDKPIRLLEAAELDININLDTT
ncbi:MAG: ATP-binding protein [Lentisphaeria bacterium]|nr:ATP-binding protein [Lentisphaeria bacterium]